MQKISGSVGHLGVNREEDVKTVQRMLNAIATSDGGPARDLDEDGIAGPKTISAIRIFQHHHFRWRGADGRVDVNHQTIKKLTALQPKAPPPPGKSAPPPKQPVPPPKAKRQPASTFVFQQPGKAHTTVSGPEDFFFKVFDTTNNRAQLFFFGGPHGLHTVKNRPGFAEGGGVALSIFHAKAHDLALEDLAGAVGGYFTKENGQKQHSELVLVSTVGGQNRSVRVKLLRHLNPPPSPGATARSTTSVGGTFQLVSNPGKWIDKF